MKLAIFSFTFTSLSTIIPSLLVITFLFSAAVSQANLEIPNPIRQLEVTVIKGNKIPLILGQDTSNYSVMAVRDNRLMPIPYQFDDQNIKGLSYVPGGKVPVAGTENVLDPEDELVFMYKDMGVKARQEQTQQIAGNIISEFEISEQGISRYAYLVEGNSERSGKIYAHYNFETGYLETETYSLQFDPKNILIWSDWKIKGFTGTESSPNVLDTMKVRIFAKMGFLKAKLNNHLVPAKTISVKNGPVRAIVEADVSLGLFGIDLIKGGVSTTFTAQTIEYPIFAAIPKAAGVLSDFAIDVTLDYVDLEGSRYRTQLGPEEPLITGIEVNDNIRAEYRSDLDNPWVSISTGKNWDMFFVFQTEQGFRPKLNAIYRDSSAGDKPNPPERFKGSSAELGVRLSEVPVGVETSLRYNLYFGPNLWQGNAPQNAANYIFNPASVTVNQNLVAAN